MSESSFASLQETTTQVVYHSSGQCLLVSSDLDKGMAVAESLAPLAVAVVIVDPANTSPQKLLSDTGITVVMVPALKASGHLGAFTLSVPEQPDFPSDVFFSRQDGSSGDLLLDMLAEPLISARVPPFGYFRGHTPATLAAAEAALPDMSGEFEKPRYFNYQPERCAHSRRRLPGCNQCLQVCAADAITADGDGIRIDPNLCQGCGSCTSVCPGGAITYRWPSLPRAIRLTRRMHSEKPQARHLLIYRQSEDAEADAAFEQSLPDQAMAVAVEEVTAFALDFWLLQLCDGFDAITVVVEPGEHGHTEDHPDLHALEFQGGILNTLVDPLGYGPAVIQFVAGKAAALAQMAEPEGIGAAPAGTTAGQSGAVESVGVSVPPASFEVFDDKRQSIRHALDYLQKATGVTLPVLGLPEAAAGARAPFGRVVVDASACTLCMACVSVCPAGALLDGQDKPQLRFIESKCLQCGICKAGCPESAITLQARYQPDSARANAIELLVEETPFHCIRCNKAFATQKMIETMASRLSGHWMFAGEQAKRRLQMCEDCRVVDLLEKDASAFGAAASEAEKPHG